VERGDKLARTVRLLQIQRLLFEEPLGLTTRQLAELCGVSQRTIQRDLLALHDMQVPVAQKGDRYSILQSYILPPITFSLYEALALFLASRLILRQTDESNPHIQSALSKLATALPAALGHKLLLSVEAIAAKAPDSHYVSIFEQIAIAWATQRRLRVLYHSLRQSEAKMWLLDPYFVEMTGVGYSAYVIGYAKGEEREGLTTFKLDRIRDVELLDETFDIPPHLDIQRLLSSSWGIIWDETTTEVKLRFSSQVTRRVKESIWHPSQKVEDLPDGGCIMTLQVANVLEMVPWIRGWGPDVEVLAPEELRAQFRVWSEHLHNIYHP